MICLIAFHLLKSGVMTDIHPTAIIEDGANIGSNVSIGPYCIIGPHVQIDNNVTLKSHIAIEGRTIIGKGTSIYPFVSLGSAPQDLKFYGEESRLVIGSNNVIREHVTMNPGTEGGGMETRVGNNCLFMTASHVAHDCIVGDNVILANNATLGGHVVVGDYAILGGLSAVRQFVRIGAHAMIGGMSGVENDVVPYGLVMGERAHLAGLNLVGLERRGFDKNDIKALMRAFRFIFHGNGTFADRLDTASHEYAGNKLAEHMISFARDKKKLPLCQPKDKD